MSDEPFRLKLRPDSPPAMELRYADIRARLTAIRALVDEQAEDDGLWFHAETAPEAYLQQELRKPHALIEEKS